MNLNIYPFYEIIIVSSRVIFIVNNFYSVVQYIRELKSYLRRLRSQTNKQKKERQNYVHSCFPILLLPTDWLAHNSSIIELCSGMYSFAMTNMCLVVMVVLLLYPKNIHLT